MRIAKITFIMIAALAVAALPASAQLGVNVGGATSTAGHVASGGQNAGAGLGSTVDTTVGASTDSVHKTTDGVSDKANKTADHTKQKSKQTVAKTKDKADKTAAKTEDKTEQTADQAKQTVDKAKSTNAGADVQASSSTNSKAGDDNAS